MTRTQLVTALLLVLVPLLAAAPATTPMDCSVQLGHLDTGIQDTHPEFEPGQVTAWRDFVNGRNTGPNGEHVNIAAMPLRADAGWNFTEPFPNDTNPDNDTEDNGPAYDDNGHGTATASLAAGTTLGARPNTTIISAKVLNEDGAGSFADVEAGFDFVVGEGADVVTISLGTAFPVPGAATTLDEQIHAARLNGTLTVVAAGNNYYVPSETTALGFSPHALVVGANDESGNVAMFSSPNPEVSAHGVDVRTAYKGDAYTRWSGTSFSTPKVAGWAATMMNTACQHDVPREKRPALVEERLKMHAHDDPLQPHYDEGHGTLDNDAADAANRSIGEEQQRADERAWTRNGASDTLRAAWTAG